MLVTHDIEEAIKVGDLVALFRPHGKIAQLAPPEELLAAPADDYVAGFVGFDRGIRRLSFVPDRGPARWTPARCCPPTRPSPRPWPPASRGSCVTDGAAARAAGSRRRTLAALPGDTPLGQVPAEPLGHTFTVGTDSLRAALDAAVLSPAGQAVGVDDDGRVLGVATFDQLRAAIQAAERQHQEHARQVQPAQDGPQPMMWSWIPEQLVADLAADLGERSSSACCPGAVSGW